MAVHGDGETVPDSVKFRLVEAEEVGDDSSKGLKGKKKTKTNWSQEPVEDDQSSNGHGHSRGGRGRGRGRGRGGRGGRSRMQYDDNGVYMNGVYMPNPDVRITAQWAREQIEFYFTPDNLVRDVFLRQNMDVDGYVPLAFVGSFQAVYAMHQDYDSLLEAMRQSEYLELDEENEKIRLREDWPKWLWPNADGGYGVPRYIKMEEGDETSA